MVRALSGEHMRRSETSRSIRVPFVARRSIRSGFCLAVQWRISKSSSLSRGSLQFKSSSFLRSGRRGPIHCWNRANDIRRAGCSFSFIPSGQNLHRRLHRPLISTFIEEKGRTIFLTAKIFLDNPLGILPLGSPGRERMSIIMSPRTAFLTILNSQLCTVSQSFPTFDL